VPAAVAAELDRGRAGSALAGFATVRPAWIETVNDPEAMPHCSRRTSIAEKRLPLP
jgi:hypothetical protein